jgi:hypothetical protein
MERLFLWKIISSPSIGFVFLFRTVFHFTEKVLIKEKHTFVPMAVEEEEKIKMFFCLRLNFRLDLHGLTRF